MIPYDELVEALANWRMKQGMSTRPDSGGSYAHDAARGAVPENDFGRQEGTGEVDLDQYVVEGGEDE